MNYKLILGIIILTIVSTSVFASNAPPPIPTEYWGRLMIDGSPAPDGTEVKYFDGTDWIITTTQDGWYNIILTGGDSDLTFLDDPTCATHIASSEACIPCSTNSADEDYCIEGPQEGDDVEILVDSNPVEVIWGDSASSEENVIASIPLYAGWNMISLPIEVVNNGIESMMSGLSGHRVAYYYDTLDTADHWKGYDSSTPSFTWDLSSMSPNKAYWVKVDSAQTLSMIGNQLTNNLFSLYTGWNMVSFQLYNNTIGDAMNKLTGHRVAYYYDTLDTADHWKGYDSSTPSFTWDLGEINIGKGYWVKIDSNQVWEE